MANVNIVGRREEGKTTLALFLARRYKAKIIWDPRSMIGSRQTAVLVSNPTDLEITIEEKQWTHGPIVYRPESGNVETEFTEFCEVLFPPKFTRGGFALVIDEAGELQNAHGIHPALLRVIKQHPTFPPRESVLVIQTNHRLSEFHNSCKALMNDLYIFQTTLPRDLDVLDQHTGIPEIRAIVANLPKHHCVHYIYGRMEAGVPQYEVWDNPKFWYTPLKGGVVCGSGDNNGPTLLRLHQKDGNALIHDGSRLPSPRGGQSSFIQSLEEEDEVYG
jgi:hypothetical protein